MRRRNGIGEQQSVVSVAVGILLPFLYISAGWLLFSVFLSVDIDSTRHKDSLQQDDGEGVDGGIKL